MREIENKIEEYLKELDENDKNERDIHYPNKEELRKKIKEFKESGEKQVSLTDPEAVLW